MTGTQPLIVEKTSEGVGVALLGDDQGTAERRQHGKVLPIVPGTEGKAKSAARVFSTLDSLHSKGAITDQQKNAGEEFAEEYFTAKLDPSQVADLARIPGQGKGDISVKIYAARERVTAAMKLLGGWGTPTAQAMCGILGEGRNIKEWAALYRLTSTKPISRSDARAYLIAGLCVLAENW